MDTNEVLLDKTLVISESQVNNIVRFPTGFFLDNGPLIVKISGVPPMGDGSSIACSVISYTNAYRSELYAADSGLNLQFKGVYPTLSSLQAAIPEPPSSSMAYAYNDGFFYIGNNGAWFRQLFTFLDLTTYDPNSISGDVFDMDNMVETDTSKVMTVAERTKLANLTDNFKGMYDNNTAASSEYANPVTGWYYWNVETNTIWSVSNGAWADTRSTSVGDMLQSTYDPQSISSDAFSMGSMVETTTAKVLTETERTKIASIIDTPTYTSWTTTSHNTMKGIGNRFQFDRNNDNTLHSSIYDYGNFVLATDSLIEFGYVANASPDNYVVPATLATMNTQKGWLKLGATGSPTVALDVTGEARIRNALTLNKSTTTGLYFKDTYSNRIVSGIVDNSEFVIATDNYINFARNDSVANAGEWSPITTSVLDVSNGAFRIGDGNNPEYTIDVVGTGRTRGKHIVDGIFQVGDSIEVGSYDGCDPHYLLGK